jgi:hypothetical protein
MGRSRQTTSNKPDAATMAEYNRRAGMVDNMMSNAPVAAYEGPMSAGLAPSERGAMDYFGDLMRGGGSFSGADLSGYMNPYLDEVLGATMSDINRQRDLAVGQTGDAAMRAGAFGGSRHGVAQAETERAYGDIAARTAAGLRGDAFNQAANLFGQDQQRMMQGAFGAAQIGGIERGQEQLGLDRQYQDFLRQYQDPFMRAQVQQGLLAAMPRGSTQTTTQCATARLSHVGFGGAKPAHFCCSDRRALSATWSRLVNAARMNGTASVTIGAIRCMRALWRKRCWRVSRKPLWRIRPGSYRVDYGVLQ